MSNRFHNKFHRHNHHTRPTDREGLYPDSAYDPIASAESPFRGEFYLDGDFYGLSSIYITQSLTADSVKFNDLTVQNLQVLGDVTYLDTFVFTASALEISNIGTGPALKVMQVGNEPIAHFLDVDGANSVLINQDGWVGIGTTQPLFQLHAKNIKTTGTTDDNAVGLLESVNRSAVLKLKGFIGGDIQFADQYNKTYAIITGNSNLSTVSFVVDGVDEKIIIDKNGKLTVVGEISARNLIYQGTGNSDDWNSVYSSVMATSADWDSVYNSVTATSASWDSVYSSSRATSATWDNSYTTLTSNSANWVNSYTTLTANSANWVNSYTTLTATSARWINSFTALTANSATWVNTYTTLTATSANWSSVYSSSRTASADWNTVAGKLPLSGGTVDGNTLFTKNVTIFGNLSATGVQTFANTVFSTTSSISVVHFGTIATQPGIYIGSNGPGDIASFYDIDQNLEMLHVGGANSAYPNIGIKTSVPNKTLTVVGQISATETIWDPVGNSNDWNSVYASSRANSATWVNSYTTLTSNSANWVNSYTTLTANSATWVNSYTTLTATSARWINSYTALTANSATWVNSYTTLTATSATWVNSYTTLTANSATWVNSYTTLTATSANWVNSYTTLTATSATWVNSYTTLTANSANWVNSYTTLTANSANWVNTYTTLTATSARWINSYTTLTANSATWVNTYTTLTATSANWSNSYTAVAPSSAAWTSTFTTVSATSANWNSVYATTRTNSANWEAVYSTVYYSSGNWAVAGGGTGGGDGDGGFGIIIGNPVSITAYPVTPLSLFSVDQELLPISPASTACSAISAFTNLVRGKTYTITNKAYNTINIYASPYIFIRRGTSWRANTSSLSGAFMTLPVSGCCFIRADTEFTCSVW